MGGPRDRFFTMVMVVTEPSQPPVFVDRTVVEPSGRAWKVTKTWVYLWKGNLSELVEQRLVMQIVMLRKEVGLDSEEKRRGQVVITRLVHCPPISHQRQRGCKESASCAIAARVHAEKLPRKPRLENCSGRKVPRCGRCQR